MVSSQLAVKEAWGSDRSVLSPQGGVVIGEKRPAAFDTPKKAKTPKKKKRKDPNEPVKPVSAYALFFRDTQANIKAQNPNATFGEVSKIVASMWDGLGEEQKQVGAVTPTRVCVCVFRALSLQHVCECVQASVTLTWCACVFCTLTWCVCVQGSVTLKPSSDQRFAS